MEGMHAVPCEVYTGEKRRTGKGEREKRPLVAEKKEKGMRKKTDRLRDLYMRLIDYSHLPHCSCGCGATADCRHEHGRSMTLEWQQTPEQRHVDCDEVTLRIGGVTRHTLPLRNEQW